MPSLRHLHNSSLPSHSGQREVDISHRSPTDTSIVKQAVKTIWGTIVVVEETGPKRKTDPVISVGQERKRSEQKRQIWERSALNLIQDGAILVEIDSRDRVTLEDGICFWNSTYERQRHSFCN
ncbi:hypothetical protein RRG08_054526 [Elysia crispata]|uniref:Uncharacterized protein n=1 Tax=Elysia crispata TaxID=231223 RepID=A0AAE1BAM7_9GAST|nr:hypothetical protein RRG08_054526 [Elysia crispata]